MEVLLHYLPYCGKMTQLIITCRYGFSLVEKGSGVVKEVLEWVSLTSFREPEQRKKARELGHIMGFGDEETNTPVLPES